MAYKPTNIPKKTSSVDQFTAVACT